MSKNNICQVVLPFNLEYALPKNDPVVILDEICNEAISHGKSWRIYRRMGLSI